jgi:hypothetical protein
MMNAEIKTDVVCMPTVQSTNPAPSSLGGGLLSVCCSGPSRGHDGRSTGSGSFCHVRSSDLSFLLQVLFV